MDFIISYWEVLLAIIPMVAGIATAIERITPNKTVGKVAGFLMRIVGFLAIHAEKTEIK